ncbi:hypothetical protein FOQG_01942 [Fusarium oxysporum f. sp. raphani 54005]|uniref:Dynamin N-terminal domain-containing protein n=2 Tax=Fusarium oxysporum f. sp. raphani TaxID=96318 RepID=X0D778_FUSOX|nr:hypothetical protein FOQG_01942 [Fusarium oxysporum f. sp. raphani 54005]KAG7430408.1 Nuclear GTPase SLIP-GC [Fusarium oxysporum f. sp. raphani]
MARWSIADLARMKRELDSEVEPEAEQVQSKRKAGEGNAVAPAPLVFPWTTCEAFDDVERMKIKEDALKIAEDGTAKVRKTLESTLRQLQQGSGNAVMAGQPLIERWLKEHAALGEQHQNLEILIGVEGPTGAGKSSFLDSLLEIPELFPSGHQGAATATVAKVSWNWDDAPGHLFRAKVTFQNLSDIEAMFESVLKDIKSLFDRQASQNNADPDEEAEARETIDYRIKYEMAKIKAVWGLERDNLEAAVQRQGAVASYMPLVQQILKTNPRAHQYLRQGMIEFKRSILKDIRSDVKPFMTSRASKFGSDRMFSIWPIVKDVHMFVKSDILKSGMTLVDLPGCSDSTPSRSEIAKKYSHRLDVRLVVSPIMRAADENQSQILMQSGFDEAQMKIRGKYDGHGFGIILSKTDHLSVDGYISDLLEQHRDPEMKDKFDQLKGLTEKRARVQNGIKKLAIDIKKAKVDEKKARDAYSEAAKNQTNQSQNDPELCRKNIEKLQANARDQFEAVKKMSRLLEKGRARAQELSQEIFDIDHWLHQRAIEERNRFVKAHIQEKYDARQRELNRTDQGNHVLSMFPVSTEAFWKLADDTASVKGYPTLEATGVPAAQRWLLEATLSKRENHLDDMLSKYQNLMDLMRIYSNEKGQDADFSVTHADVQKALGPVHQSIAVSLSMLISAESAKIDMLDPLMNRRMAERKFRAEASRIATNWSLKEPNSELSGFMQSNTYGAIMRRGGDDFTSKGQTSMTYSWMDDMASPVLRTVSKEWDEEMNQQLRRIGVAMESAFKQGWAPYPKKLEQAIREKFPALELSFQDLILMMSSIERMSVNKIRAHIEDLSREASKVTMDAKAFLMREMKPIFDDGLMITGTGSYAKRRAHNVSGVEGQSDTMCYQMTDCLNEKLEEKKREARTRLDLVIRESIKNLKDRVDSLIDNLIDNSPADSVLKQKKTELQGHVRANLRDWEQKWQQQVAADEDANSEPGSGQGSDGEDDDMEDVEEDDDDSYNDLAELLGDDEME